jgi:hypothetical protein
MIAEAANRIMPPGSFYDAAYNSMISGLVMNQTCYVRSLASGERILWSLHRPNLPARLGLDRGAESPTDREHLYRDADWVTRLEPDLPQ